jgi:Protein of unknown function (DUF2442)
MLHISLAEYLGDHRVRVVFDNGREGVADLSAMVGNSSKVFAPLRDVSVFSQLFIKYGTLCWPGDLDVAPEYIYFLAFRDDEGLHGLFEEWGYINAEVTV